MTDNSKIYVTAEQVMSYLSLRIRGALQSLDKNDILRMQEIRLRSGRPLAVTISGREYFVTMQGRLTAYPHEGIRITRMEIEESFRAVCEYSVYSYARELREGYITLKGGARVGIAGTAVYDGSNLASMRCISSMSFRLPRQVKDCAVKLAAVNFGGLLVTGAAGSGKTTILRDLCRLLGNDKRVSLIDTRGELAGMLHGMPQYEIGLHTDVFDGFPRSTGAVTALRAMTPDYIVCDEIGTDEDVEALMQVHGCGVKIIASAHGCGMEDIQERKPLRPLISSGVFTHAAVLGSCANPGELVKIVAVQQ